jgi:hypothetical protein
MTLTHGTVLGCLLLAAVHAPDEPAKSDETKDKGVKAARMDFMKQVAKSYDITLAADAAKKSALIEEPILRFDDQVTGVVDGTVFIWMLDDRPVATASIWIRKTGHEFHEFQSLATEPLTATNQGQVKWTPTVAGVELKPVMGAKPAATAVARLGQMRAMAREYTGTIFDSKKEQQQLRLLTQPVHRYGRPDGPVVDGALFAYCKGTNPEILLLVEAVRKGNELEWQYSFARMTSRQCEVTREDKVVWSVPQARDVPTAPYFNVVLRYSGPGAVIDPPPAR